MELAKPEELYGPMSWEETICECENLCNYEHLCIICDYYYFECRIVCVDPKKVDCPINEVEPEWKKNQHYRIQCNVCTPCCKKYSISGARKMYGKFCSSCFYVLEENEIVQVETRANPKVLRFDGFYYDTNGSIPDHCIVCINCCKNYSLVYK